MSFVLDSYYQIIEKLNFFSKKFYIKRLIKGCILFGCFGLLFMLIIIGVEYFLWLNSTGRLILLFLFIVAELFLLYQYILIPLFYLFKLKRGINHKDASLLIGKHFNQVDDKLFNLLDLVEDANKSELLLASIEQRSQKLSSFKFEEAINFSDNLQYLKYLLIPVFLICFIWISGNLQSFFGSYNRVVNYNLAYEAPAPFVFDLLSPNLNVLESESVTINVTTRGEVKPEEVFIVINDVSFLLKKADNIYSYTFSPPISSSNFHFVANSIKSRDYTLTVLSVPSIASFNMVLDFPSYLNKKSEALNGTGSATIPEGTKVTWKANGSNIDNLHLIIDSTSIAFKEVNNVFTTNKHIYNNTSYSISTSNKHVKNYETLGYTLKVIKDAFPTINVNKIQDSLNPNVLYFAGEVLDDYAVDKLELVCFNVDDSQHPQTILLKSLKANIDSFYYTFPSGLDLSPNVSYNFYFKVTDNDAIHKGKSTKSNVFSLSLLDSNQLKNKVLKNNNRIVEDLDKSLNQLKKQKESLEEINKNNKEGKDANFKQQSQVKDFLSKQMQQENMMQKFSKQLKENLDKIDSDNNLNKLLKERLERQEIEAKKNEQLLKELNKVADKISKDELSKQLDKIANSQKNSQRNLEQLLELTKRYYVTEKASQLAKDLEEIAEKQNDLSVSPKDSSSVNFKNQDKLKDDFSEISKELNELKSDNKNLKKPLSLDIDDAKQDDVTKDQQEALDKMKELGNMPQDSDASKSVSNKQKSAAKKIKELSESLQQSSMGGGSDSIAEDAEMLRQILDNLITFSFKQESLYDRVSIIDPSIGQFSNSIKDQQELRGLFTHVDDSLFSLSLRRAELSEFVNEQITDVYYNLDKSLESLADNKLYQGVSYQQYVINASNSLADFLVDLLDNMQQSMKPGSGSGKGEAGFQLPDIIKSQGELQDKMQGKGQKGSTGSSGSSSGESGEGGKKGKGSSGESSGSNGKSKDGSSDKQGYGQSGSGGSNSNGSDSGTSESDLKELYEIYKMQQQIKEHLQSQLNNIIKNVDKSLAQKLIRQMEDFSNDLLENGITQRTVNKVNFIQHQLLKLENAALKQGQNSKRKSNTNLNSYNNPVMTKPSQLKDYIDQIEFLNRQALPLQQNLQEKVKGYFKNDN